MLPPRSPEQLLRRAYEAFNARDIDAALALMHLDVDWPNGMEGGRDGLIERTDIGDASVVARPPKPPPAPPPTPGIGSPETRGGGNGKRR
jgi:hypothetical protein